ncbi:oxygenase MpaB family protein [Nocardioides sp.]|uniref:oxygenase MpaB family protein n=1 Tax=Nocardioides sp. TaxID=35761 RepID=UPI00286AE791|nr:oxygenase MpaB family protein [Nocardioides sp.]
MRKTLWADRNAQLDPETDHAEIYRNLTLYEFPWDFNQSLGFALFRTYAVPSIGSLLDATGQFTGACQKRYDDTGILLEAPLVSGFTSRDGKVAIRRINQMHRMYDISNDDLRYVLATFVVVPKRWLDDFGWRTLSDGELRASVNYYRELGRHMAITDVPDTYDGFATLMDDYEAEHFAFDPGARRVADATLALMASFYPRPAAKGVDVFSRALMDPPLLAAFRYGDPGRAARRASTAALRARARLLAHAPSRRKPIFVHDLAKVKSYPGGYDLAAMGTFTPGCPVPHR